MELALAVLLALPEAELLPEDVAPAEVAQVAL